MEGEGERSSQSGSGSFDQCMLYAYTEVASAQPHWDEQVTCSSLGKKSSLAGTCRP